MIKKLFSEFTYVMHKRNLDTSNRCFAYHVPGSTGHALGELYFEISNFWLAVYKAVI